MLNTKNYNDNREKFNDVYSSLGFLVNQFSVVHYLGAR